MTTIINIKKTDGMALLVSVVVLTVVLCLTIATMNNTAFNQRISINLQSTLQSQAGAQAAINEAQQYIMAQKPGTQLFTATCTNGLCTYQKNTSIWSTATSWNGAKTLQSNFQSKSKTLSTPSYIIEYMGDKKYQDSLSVSNEYGTNQDTSTKPVYRITGKSKGLRGTKETVIQSTVY